MTRRLGLTFDLKADHLARGATAEDASEFEDEETVVALEAAARALGWEVERIGHVQALVQALAAGRRWDLVYNMAEGLRGFGREAQVPALLEAYDIPFTGSDSMVLAIALHKGMAKHVVRGLGIPTPDFAVVETEAQAAAVDLPFPLFVKPVAEGSSKGVHETSRVSDRAALLAACAESVRRFRQPALVETYLPGRELTVSIVGTGARAEVVGVLEAMQDLTDAVYSYEIKVDWVGRVRYQLVDGPVGAVAKALALAAWRGLGCRDVGRVDLRGDAFGRLQFLELNPLPGQRPGVSDLCVTCDLLGIPYQDMVGRVIRSALERAEAVR